MTASLPMLTLGVSGVAGAVWADPAGPQSDAKSAAGSSPFDSGDVPGADSLPTSATELDAEGEDAELGDDATATPEASSESSVGSGAGDVSAPDEPAGDVSGEEPVIDPGAPCMAPAALRGTTPLQAQVQAVNHHEIDGTTGGDTCYGSAAAGTVSGKILNPGGGAGSTTFVGPGKMVCSVHDCGQECGNPSCTYYGGQESGELNSKVKSTAGSAPHEVGSASIEKELALGYFVRTNNPTAGSGGGGGQYYAATLNIKFTLSGVGKTLSFPWTVHETPNNGPHPNDILNFTSMATSVSSESGNLNYTLTIHGFTQNTGVSCPVEFTGGTSLSGQLITVEDQKTYGCLWVSIEQVHKATIEKKIEGAPDMVDGMPTTEFGFMTTGELINLWGAGGEFSLKPKEAAPAMEVGENGYNTGKELKITEDTPGANWSLKSLSYKDTDEQGTPIGSISGGTLTLVEGLLEEDSVKVLIRCTYTNLYTPSVTTTLLKKVSSGTVAASNRTFSVTHGTESVNGDSGASAKVTPNQEYTLSEKPKADFSEVGQYEPEAWSYSAN